MDDKFYGLKNSKHISSIKINCSFKSQLGNNNKQTKYFLKKYTSNEI